MQSIVSRGRRRADGLARLIRDYKRNHHCQATGQHRKDIVEIGSDRPALRRFVWEKLSAWYGNILLDNEILKRHNSSKDLFENPDSVLSKIFRAPAEPELWSKVFVWIVPVQILRAFLIAVVLYLFFDTLNGWEYRKRFLSIAGLLVVLGHFAGSSGIKKAWHLIQQIYFATLRKLLN